MTGAASLTTLAVACEEKLGVHVSPVDAAYLIRHLAIGDGCTNLCTHCFAEPPARLVQMNFRTFTDLAGEIGEAVRQRGVALPFLFFGAATDPSMVVDFSRYLEAWLLATPNLVRVKLYTHGWWLGSVAQQIEFEAVEGAVRRHSARMQTVGLSFDLFSRYARADWDSYVENVGRNLRRFVTVLPLAALKLQVTYPVDRLDVDEVLTLRHWRGLAVGAGRVLTDEAIEAALGRATTPAEVSCARLTSGVFAVGKVAGLSLGQTIHIAQDNGIPFPSGRARVMFKGRSTQEIECARVAQRHALSALSDFRLGTVGVVIYPSGSARVIDCFGYRLGDWLSRGLPVVRSQGLVARGPWPTNETWVDDGPVGIKT